MTTIESNSTGKIKKTGGKILAMPVRHSGSSTPPFIRRLPIAYAMMNNININESIIPAARTMEDNDIYVKVNSVLKRIKLKDIYLVEGLCDYINIHTNERRYTIYSTMYGILEKLPASEFIRVHRSYIVRLNCISSLENNMLNVEMRKIPVGGTYKKSVLSRLNIIHTRSRSVSPVN